MLFCTAAVITSMIKLSTPRSAELTDCGSHQVHAWKFGKPLRLPSTTSLVWAAVLQEESSVACETQQHRLQTAAKFMQDTGIQGILKAFSQLFVACHPAHAVRCRPTLAQEFMLDPVEQRHLTKACGQLDGGLCRVRMSACWMSASHNLGNLFL